MDKDKKNKKKYIDHETEKFYKKAKAQVFIALSDIDIESSIRDC
jgi:hypothetical protein